MSSLFKNYFQRFIYILLLFSICELSSSNVLPSQTSSFEFETLTIKDSDGTTNVRIKSNSKASDRSFLLYASNAIGEFVTFPLEVNTAGTYDVSLQYQLSKHRGTFKAEVADNIAGPYVKIGTMNKKVNRGYRFPTLKMTATFSTNGTKYLRLTVIGSNPFTGSEKIGLDKVDLTLTNVAVNTTGPQNYIDIDPLRDLGFSDGDACFRIKAYTNTDISEFSELACKFIENSNMHTLSWNHDGDTVIGFLVYFFDTDTQTDVLLADMM